MEEGTSMTETALKLEISDRYKDEDGFSWYPFNGKEFVSVTTVIEHGAPVPIKMKNYWKRNSEAKIEKTLTETANIGSSFHAVNESILTGTQMDIPVHLTPHAEAFRNWVSEHQVKPIHIEKTLISEKYGFAGTADFIGYVDGELVVADWKSSNVYKKESYAMQLGAYRLAAIEMGILPENAGMICVQIKRDNAELNHFKYVHFESCENAFLRALDQFKFYYFYKLKARNWSWLEERALMRVI